MEIEQSTPVRNLNMSESEARAATDILMAAQSIECAEEIEAAAASGNVAHLIPGKEGGCPKAIVGSQDSLLFLGPPFASMTEDLAAITVEDSVIGLAKLGIHLPSGCGVYRWRIEGPNPSALENSKIFKTLQLKGK